MITKIQKWGNSQGLRVSRELLDKASIAVGDEVDVNIRGGEIIIKSSSRIRGKYRLKDLVAGMPRNYAPSETDWGRPSGKEVW